MKKILSLCLAVLLCAALCGCQRKISLPAVKEIASIQVETTDGRAITLTQESEKAQLMDLLSTGVSTGRQSVQDQPLATPYGTILLENHGGVTTLYYYQERGATLIEQPYTGIFRLKGPVEPLLSPEE